MSTPPPIDSDECCHPCHPCPDCERRLRAVLSLAVAWRNTSGDIDIGADLAEAVDDYLRGADA